MISENAETPRPEPWLYYLMCCDHSSEGRGSNNRGNPCGEHGILRRRTPITWKRPQVRCPQQGCTHRLRVNPSNTLLCANLQDAKRRLEAIQRGEVVL